MKSDLKTLAGRLKKSRADLGFSQSVLSDRSGVSQQALQRIEAGRVLTTTLLVDLAVALQVSPVWLQLGRGDKKCVCGIKHRKLLRG